MKTTDEPKPHRRCLFEKSFFLPSLHSPLILKNTGRKGIEGIKMA
jgi:hypothetical protein